MTAKELLEYAKKYGKLDDFMHTDIFTGRRTPYTDAQLQEWIDQARKEIE